MRYLLVFILYFFALFSADYDCIIIGTSPFSMFEALYQYHSGNSVLILEKSNQCGGAWKTIDICGVKNVDLGCHQVGTDTVLKKFIEDYAGCTIVSLDNPTTDFEPTKRSSGWYFSQGCHELITNLIELINKTEIDLKLGTEAKDLSIDQANNEAIIQTSEGDFSAKKVILTPMTSIGVSQIAHPQFKGGKHYHLYMLIEDSTPFRFTYRNSLAPGISRMMNCTHFTNLSGTGKQLIAIQTYNDQYLSNEQQYLDAMKESNLIDLEARILETDTYTYHSGSFYQGVIQQLGAKKFVEVLQTGHIKNLCRYIPRWEEVLKPYKTAIEN